MDRHNYIYWPKGYVIVQYSYVARSAWTIKQKPRIKQKQLLCKDGLWHDNQDVHWGRRVMSTA